MGEDVVLACWLIRTRLPERNDFRHEHGKVVLYTTRVGVPHMTDHDFEAIYEHTPGRCAEPALQRLR